MGDWKTQIVSKYDFGYGVFTGPWICQEWTQVCGTIPVATHKVIGKSCESEYLIIKTHLLPR